MGALKGDDVSLEAQICRVSDAVAYLNHDIGDAIRAGVISEDDLPPGLQGSPRDAPLPADRHYGQRHSEILLEHC